MKDLNPITPGTPIIRWDDCSYLNYRAIPTTTTRQAVSIRY
jgi:hypothetical protein